jgi:hypothetical protein
VKTLLVFLLLTTPVLAKEVTVTFNDDELAALRNVLDIATHAQGMQIAPFTVYLQNKLNAAVNAPAQPAQEPAK